MRQDAGWKEAAPETTGPSAEPRLAWQARDGQPAAEALQVSAQLACRAPQPFDDIEELRRRYEACRKPFVPAREAVDSVFHVHPRAGEGPPVSVIRPIASVDRKSMSAILFLHGGGWTAGTFEIYEPLCRQIANATDSIVVYVHYRLAPEHPFPAAFDDTRAALRWVHANRRWLGIDPDRIALAGDGAGGNLAAAACLAECNEATGYQPHRQILLYPCLDMSACMPSHKTPDAHGPLTAQMHRRYRQAYAAGHSKPGLWRLSPLFAYDVSRLPPSVILYAGFDRLRDEAVAYAGRLQESGVPVESLGFADMIHDFMLLGGALAAANVAVRRVAQAVAGLPAAKPRQKGFGSGTCALPTI
ncbi:MAG: alpha/beta hydrolase fold domain-containing protein [Rhizomicrobium sp.]